MTAVESHSTDRSQAFPALAAELDRRFADQLAGASRLELDLAGVSVTVELSSADLAAALAPALGRLASGPNTAADLTLRALAGGSPPALEWPLSPPPNGEATLRLGEERFVVAGATPPSLAVADLAAGRAWFWVADAGDLSIAERAAPFLRLLAASLARRRRWVVHGGAVGDGRRALLLVGRGGSGKSTSCLAALAAGLELAGDDYVMVRTDSSPPTVHALFAAAKADDSALRRLAAAGVELPVRTRAPHDKSLLDLGGRTVRWSSAAPLGAIVLPRIAQRTAAPLPVSSAEALRALAPSSLFQLADHAAERFAACVSISRELPAFRLEVGPDLRQVADALRSLLASLPGETPA